MTTLGDIIGDLAIAKSAYSRATNIIAEAIPTEDSALTLIKVAYDRLVHLGFQDAQYCPQDGSLFEAIIASEEAITICFYKGKWPTGTFYAMRGSKKWPVRPILWRKLK